MELCDVANDGFAAVVPDICDWPWDFWRRTAERLKATAVPSVLDVAAVPRAIRRIIRLGTIGCEPAVRTWIKIEQVVAGYVP